MKLISILCFFVFFTFGKLFYSDTNKTILYTPIEQQETSLAKSMSQGKEIYLDFCVQCHLADGKGSPENIPPLDGSNWLTKKRAKSIHVVKFGRNSTIKVNGITYYRAMPPMGLTDEEVADVMNYIMNSWSNKQQKVVTVKEVQTIKN